MAQAVIPQQHPAVVLRSRYTLVRTMLAIAMIAVVCLAAAVVLLAIDDDGATSVNPAPAAAPPASSSTGATRFDGGPEEGTRGQLDVRSPLHLQRFDGGPEEGSAGH